MLKVVFFTSSISEFWLVLMSLRALSVAIYAGFIAVTPVIVR